MTIYSYSGSPISVLGGGIYFFEDTIVFAPNSGGILTSYCYFSALRMVQVLVNCLWKIQVITNFSATSMGDSRDSTVFFNRHECACNSIKMGS